MLAWSLFQRHCLKKTSKNSSSSPAKEKRSRTRKPRATAPIEVTEPAAIEPSETATDGQKRGHDLLEQVIALTGIPGQAIQRELKSILDRKNIDLNHLTMEQLRGVAASYLREIMGGLLDRSGSKKPEINH